MMKKNIIVIDDFYNNPTETRNYILTQDFHVTGNFPGSRTETYATNSLKKYFQSIVGKEITWFPTRDTYNGAFQYTTKDMTSWVHRDTTRWAGVLYLTPGAPLSSGTAFFRHKETGLEEVNQDTPTHIKKELDDDSNDMSKWDQVDYVANKFNRLILFRGTRSHRSMDYFGDSKYNGRLFQLFFFNVDESADLKYILPKSVSSHKTRTLEPLKWDKPDKLKIAILIFTTSRYEYLLPTLESFYKMVDFGDFELYTIMTDDYPLRRDKKVLEDLKKMYNIDKLVINEENLGYGLSWKNAWKLIPNDVDYIWHQEEDFMFNEKINVMDLITTFNTCPVELTQLVLKRQIWFSNNDFIEMIEKGEVGEQINFGDKKVVIHQYYFNANPCIYPKWIIDEEYEYDPQEHTIVETLKKRYPSKYSGMYGGIMDIPLVKHTGDYNQGKKIIEGQPGYSTVKAYDPDKKYDSRKYLVEY